MLAAYNLDAVDLRPLATLDMTARIDAALVQAPRDLLQFEFERLRFGALSVMDLVLALKISDFSELDESDRRVWLQYLRSCLLSYLLVDRLCREMGVARIVHCNDYSLLLGARTAARKHGVPCYGMAFPGHRNVDLRRYMILPNVWRAAGFKLLGAWPACRNLALDPPRVCEVAEDLLVRLRGVGSHLYSPGKTVQETDVRHRFGLAEERRLLVAYTSSLDELIASANGDRGAGNRDSRSTSAIQGPDRVVAGACRLRGTERRSRAHRAHSSARGRQQARIGRFATSVAPAGRVRGNVRALSVCVAGRSRFELRRRRGSRPGAHELEHDRPGEGATGGPGAGRVQRCFGKVPIPGDDFYEWESTPAAYFDKLRALLDRPVSAAQIARAFRWYSLLTLGTTLDLTDVIPRSDFAGLPPCQTPREAAAIEQIVIGGKDICDLNIERLRESQSPEREVSNLDALLRQNASAFRALSDDGRRLAGRCAALRRLRPGGGPGPSRSTDIGCLIATLIEFIAVLLRWPLVSPCCAAAKRGSPCRSVAGDDSVLDRQHRLSGLPGIALRGGSASPKRRGYEDAKRPSATPVLFGVSDFYPRNLVQLGHPAVEYSINNRRLQETWARERRLALSTAGSAHLVLRRGFVPWVVRDQTAWMEQILAAQIVKDFRPDVMRVPFS